MASSNIKSPVSGVRLDSHQHFWRYDAGQYPWIPAGSRLQRDWLPADLAELQRPLGFDGSIAVQARQSLAETRWLLELADADPRVKGVVGWVDLQSEAVTDQLAEFAGNPRLAGVRHVVQDEPDDNFLLRPAFQRGIGELQHFGLTYDLLIYPKQLPAAIKLVRRFPEQPFVLDHIAKPYIKAGNLSPWREQIGELAKLPNVLCKVSGMVTEADHLRWKPEDFRPYLDATFAAFGEDRLMFGSDWPVCQLAADYAQVVDLVGDYAAQFSADAQAKLFGGNAAKFYLSR
jgi:L-fuconolactonase